MLCGVKMSTLVPNTRLIKTTIGQYILKSLVDKNIHVGFGHKYGYYSPIYKNIHQNDEFDLISEEHEQNSGYKALSYAKNTNNMGVIISTSTIGFRNIMKPIEFAKNNKQPLLLLSFFDSNDELKSSPFSGKSKSFIKESVTIKKPDYFPAEMESILSYGYEFPAGPVHFNVSNQILDLPI